MSFENFRSSGEDWDLSKKIRKDVEMRAKDAGISVEEMFPSEKQVSLDQYRTTIEHEMVEDFGIPEIPKQILTEMEYVIRVIEQHAEKDLFQDEADDAIIEKLHILAVKISHFKENPSAVSLKAIPEEGYEYSYTNNDGKEVSGSMSEDEEDLIAQLELWADQLVQMKNIDQFKKTIGVLKDRAKIKPESERAPYVESQLVSKYRSFGFTPEQIHDLLVLSESNDVTDLKPEGEVGEVDRLRIMKGIWQQYLSDGEKSRYIKFAAGMTIAGAVEGTAPMLLGKAIDAPTLEMAAMFALSYFGMEAGMGWIKRHLTVEFDSFLNQIMEKEGGLNQKLAEDLVFQPGEKMLSREDQGRLIATIGRSKGAFRDVMGSVAKVSVPAIASTTVGLGLMMANDWRLGLISLASAPIAVAIGRRTEKKLGPLISDSYVNDGKVASQVQEQVMAHQDITLGGQRQEMAEQLAEKSKESNQIAHDRMAAREDMMFQTGYVLNQAVIAGMTFAGVLFKRFGIPDTGKLVSALVYSGSFRNNFNEIVRANSHLLESLKAITEMEEVFNGFAEQETSEDKERVGASAISEYAIDVKDVSLELGGRSIMEHVSFQIPAGGVVRIEGRTGGGKTTMSRLMSGYLEPTSGEVAIGGYAVKDVKKTGPDSLYKHIAYLSQHPYIFETGDLRANLAFGNEDVSDEDMKKVLKELGLEKRFHVGSSILLESRVGGLSGGEKARLGLARVLLKMRSQENGGIVFLDQATEELDEETEKEIAALIRAEKKRRPNMTMVIISHRNDFIRELEGGSDEEKLLVQRVRLEKKE